MRGDPGRHGRYVAVEGREYTRPCKTKKRDVLLRIPKTTIFVPDTEKCPWLWLIHLRYVTKNSLENKEKTLDYIGRRIHEHIYYSRNRN